jgi:PhnB protein
MTVVPMIDYADGPAALDWLARAFGFVETVRLLSDRGVLEHGEMTASGGRLMLGTATPAYEGPKAHREHCERARAWSEVPYVIDGVLVYVDDVDAHFARAVEHGATILSEPEDAPPGRLYRVEDLEGHRWMFIQAPK